MGMLVMWVTMLSAYHAFAHAMLMVAFTVARCAHTVCFALKLQPWRSLCWLVGVLAVLFMLANGLHGLFAMIPLGMGTTLVKP